MTAPDLVIANGRIVDGCGNPWYRGDVAVRGDRIAAIGAPGALRGRAVVDAADRYVTPGFVDPHTHSDISILQYPRAESAVRQGVTTHVTGNCGMSPAPLERGAPRRRAAQLGALLGHQRGRLGLAELPPVPPALERRGRGHQHRPARRPRRPAAGGRWASPSAPPPSASSRAWSGCWTQPCAPAPTASPPASSTRRGASPTPTSSSPLPRRRAATAASTPRTCAASARRSSRPSPRRIDIGATCRRAGRGLAQRAQVGRARGRRRQPRAHRGGARARVWT